MSCLMREVKRDGKGLFIHFGPCRLRPVEPETTRFEPNDQVLIEPEKHRYIEGVQVSKERGYSEIWRRQANF